MAHIKHTEDGTPYISNDWHVEDVESVCEQMEVTLTEDEMEDVLHSVRTALMLTTASHGITLSSIQNIIDGRKNEMPRVIITWEWKMLLKVWVR